VIAARNIFGQKSLRGTNLSYKIDDSLVWRQCEFTAWSCITCVYLEVYLMHKSSRSKVKFVYICQSHIVKIMNKIE